MTAAEFAKKYGITYTTVRSATFRTATRQDCSRSLDYGEPELKRAVREELQQRLIWHRDKLTAIAGELEKLDRKEAAGDGQ